jgi:hypothetical protein
VSWHNFCFYFQRFKIHKQSKGAEMKKLRIKYAVAAIFGALTITPAMATPVLDTQGSVLMGITGRRTKWHINHVKEF